MGVLFKFFDKNNATISGEIYYTSGGTYTQIITFSDQIISGNIPGKFCFFDTNDILYLKNSTNITKTVTFHKMF